MSDQLPFAAALYQPKKTDKSALGRFAEELRGQNVDLAGLLQEAHIKPGESMRTIESVDLRSGHRIAIKNPMKSEGECGLDTANLVETTAVLREILQNPPQLVLLEKFGGQEQEGKGLMDEIMQIISAKIPLIISVPEPSLPIWRELTQNMGAEIGFTVPEMTDWWKKTSNQPD